MTTLTTAGPGAGVTAQASVPARGADHRSGPVPIDGLTDYAIRFVGRTFVGMPASTWLLIDLCLLTAAVRIAYAVYPGYVLVDTPHIALWQASAIFAFSIVVASLVFGLYERETLSGRSRAVTRMLISTVAAAIVAYGIIYIIMYATISRRNAALAMSLFFVGGSAIRLAAVWAIGNVHRGLLVVGSKSLFESFRRAQIGGFLNEYRLAGFANTENEPLGQASDPFYLGRIGDELSNLSERGVTDIVVGAAAARDPRVMEWMVPCLRAGCRVTNEAIFYEKATGQILVDEITPHWFLFADLKVHCDQQATLKRLVDLATAFVGLCLSAPAWPVIAIMVKLCDGGPVFYSQDRVGQNGKVFRLPKFRTMRPDAENGRSLWASPNDPRVTRVGRFLRRTRLDELPQLYNVLVGQMSIVGPRPERPDIVEDLCQTLPYYAERHLVKPGLTGWAQISFRYGSSIEDAKQKLQFDLYYLKHMSFELDAVILFRTIGTFLKGAC